MFKCFSSSYNVWLFCKKLYDSEWTVYIFMFEVPDKSVQSVFKSHLFISSAYCEKKTYVFISVFIGSFVYMQSCAAFYKDGADYE